MKNLKKTYIACLIILTSITGFAQKSYLDSVSVEIADKIELGMSIYEYSNLIETVENDLKSLQEILKLNKNIPEKSPYAIIYKPDEKLSIRQLEPIEKIIWENGKQTSYQFHNTCEILSEKYHLNIEYNELESLVSNDLILKLKEVLDTTNTIQDRFSSTYNYTFKEGNMVHNSEFDKVSGQTDMLFLKGGVGASLIKNKPVIDISAEIGISLSKKGLLKNQYYVSYNLLFDFIDDPTINLNSFINLGYRYNLSRTDNDSNWLGVEFGYLVAKNGGMFDKNTFKFGVNWEVGKYISISPQLYFSKEQFYPAVRIGFGF